jgi:hypothetical protein
MHDRDSRPERRTERRGYAGRDEGWDARPESADAARAETEREPLGDRLLILEVDEQEADAASIVLMVSPARLRTGIERLTAHATCMRAVRGPDECTLAYRRIDGGLMFGGASDPDRTTPK